MSEIQRLRDIVFKLRAPDGCPWDREQTHHSLARCLVEEASEVLEAIDGDDSELMEEELGDLLLQVVMHACLAEEVDRFDLEDVARGINEKLIPATLMFLVAMIKRLIPPPRSWIVGSKSRLRKKRTNLRQVYPRNSSRICRLACRPCFLPMTFTSVPSKPVLSRMANGMTIRQRSCPKASTKTPLGALCSN